MAEHESPKIIVDTDWKSQAQAEKDRLAEQERTAAQAKAAQGGAAGAAGGPGQEAPPEASFEEMVRLLATQALLYMGAFPDPETGRAIVSPELARLNIDLLGILEEKTKGNLTQPESQMLTSVLGELRMQFVEVSKAIAKAIEQGRMSPQGGMMGASPAGSVPPGPPPAGTT